MKSTKKNTFSLSTRKETDIDANRDQMILMFMLSE